ncbi:MAG: GNAT family N-acetyltransferase [Egibacteraceae bacterium]
MDIEIRPLDQEDLDEADRVFREAFRTFLGADIFGDADYVRGRWAADPAAALGAFVDGRLVGSNFATRWGSVGFFGPLTVRPELWDRGMASRLLEATMPIFESWGTAHNGLFTFAHSPKHHWLYQKFGFWPRFLTPIMSKPVTKRPPGARWSPLSQAQPGEQPALIQACAEVTRAVLDGLVAEREIRAAVDLGLGEVVLLPDAEGVRGFAVCHIGAGSEAGSGRCYVKFGAVRSGPGAAKAFAALLDASEALAAERGLERLVAGVNTARHEAYRVMLAHGFRTDLTGVTMHRPNDPGYDRPDVFLIDDWR